MLFNSYIFILLFLPLTVIGYYWLNQKNKYSAGMFWLVMMSCIFCGYLDIRYLLALLFSLGGNYGILCLMKRNPIEKVSRRWLAIGITGNILFLLYFKYANFFLENISLLTGREFSALKLFMPLGISFYTFQQITCLVDCHRDKTLQPSFLEYAVYVSFFPQFIQGPIMLIGEMLPNLRDEKKKQWNDEAFAVGMYAFALGLGKKVLLADTLAQTVNVGYKEVWQLNSLSAIVTILAYTLQIYFDFSGYCDMAVGLGKMFQLEIPINFHSPYKAVSIVDFWDRWHITLTRFFTRYVYIPLGGSREGHVRTYANVFLIFLLSGLWHGAAWTFVYWGVLHGIAMLLKRLMNDLKIRLPRWLEWTATFVFVNAAWVFFRADSMKQAKKMLTKVVQGGGGWIQDFLYEGFEDKMEVALLMRLDVIHLLQKMPGLIFVLFFLGVLLACVVMKNTQEKIKSFQPTTGKLLVTMCLIFWSVISLSGISEFIYFNF